MPRLVGSHVPEDRDPALRAKALEALRLRLDQTATWPDERCWPAIARALGYASGDEAKRAAWRTFNRTAYSTESFTFHSFMMLAKALDFPPSVREIRVMLRELDERKAPEDRDPPTPKKQSKAALRRALAAHIEALSKTVDADPDPRAVAIPAQETRTQPRDA